MTTWPAASTPCTWKTDLAMSRPIVVIVCIVSSSPNRGSFNSAHIRGTHVPVEEPSTASTTDLQRLPQHVSSVLFSKITSTFSKCPDSHDPSDRIGLEAY